MGGIWDIGTMSLPRSPFHFSGEIRKVRELVSSQRHSPCWVILSGRPVVPWLHTDNSQFLMTMNPVKLWCRVVCTSTVCCEIIPTYGQSCAWDCNGTQQIYQADNKPIQCNVNYYRNIRETFGIYDNCALHGCIVYSTTKYLNLP